MRTYDWNNLCTIFIGFSQISLRKSYKEFPPSVAFFFDSLFGLFIWVPLAVFMGISGTASWGEAILFAIVSAILSEAIVFYALSQDLVLPPEVLEGIATIYRELPDPTS